MRALVRFCGATYELTLAPSFRIGDYPTFSAAFLDISLSAAAILVNAWVCVGHALSPCYPDRFVKRKPRFARGILQTSAFDGRSIPAVCDACINGVPPRALQRVNAEPWSRQSRGDGITIAFDRHFCRLDYRKDGVALFEIYSLHRAIMQSISNECAMQLLRPRLATSFGRET